MPRPRAISAPARRRPFWRITLPLTAPGVAAGAVFVFVLSIGNFVTPDLLGGGKLQMVGNLIYDQFLTARDWPFGSALSVILIAIMLLLLFAQAIAANRARGRGQGAMRKRLISISVRLCLSLHADRRADGPVLQQGGPADRLDRFFDRMVRPARWKAPRSSPRRRNSLIVAMALDPDRDRDRHAARLGRRAAQGFASARCAALRADDHPRHRPGDRASVLLHADEIHPRAALDHPGPCRLQHRLRLRRGARQAQELRLVADRGLARSGRHRA